jgi:Peroxisomal biogenesis factor 11 (PEX11)
MRIGKPVEHLQAALKTGFAPGPALETIAGVARQIAYFAYLSYDAVSWVLPQLIIVDIPTKPSSRHIQSSS